MDKSEKKASKNGTTYQNSLFYSLPTQENVEKILNFFDLKMDNFSSEIGQNRPFLVNFLIKKCRIFHRKKGSNS